MNLDSLSRALRAKLAVEVRSEQTIERADAGSPLASTVARSSGPSLPQPTPTRVPPADPATAAPNTSISPAGRLVAQLMLAPAGERLAPAITTTQPIVDDAISVPVIAQALERTITESGLFYESHVVEWIQGKRGQEALLREPQARLAQPQTGDPDPAANESKDGSAAPLHQSGTADRAMQVASEREHLTWRSIFAAAPQAVEERAAAERVASTTLGEPVRMESDPAARPPVPEATVAPEAARIVRHQLEALAAESIVWRGPLRQGEPGEIEIGRESRLSSGEPAEVWRARLKLELPRLGAVEVAITLDSGNLSLAFRSSSDARSALADHARALQSALDAQALRLSACKFLEPAVTERDPT